MSDAPHTPMAATGLVWLGWMTILAGALLRAQTSLVPFPYWDMDPTVAPDVILGIGPAGSVLLDIMILLGAGVALLGFALRGHRFRRVHIISAVLIAIGAAGASLHAWVLPSGTIEDTRMAATWIAALAGGLAAFHICTLERLRRLTFAIATGFVVMLAAKGALEVFIEHPMTVESYRLDQEAFLAAQGWAPDSVQARNFERRLTQPEATGWFGMANVYASFAAAGFVALLGLAVIAWRASRIQGTLPDGWAGLLTFGAAAGAAAVALAGGKGGYTAAVLGVVLLGFGAVAFRWIQKRNNAVSPRTGMHLGSLLAIGVVILALVAVVLRGLVGERIGELSLLFRWFYMQGAVRIISENPILGVGPAGFKEAYLLAKPPLSPEEISSPHSILFDWTATLGLAGIALCAAWLTWVWMAGRTGVHALLTPASTASPQVETSSRGSFDTGEERTDARIVLLVAGATMIVSAWLEQRGMTVESAVMRFVGIIGWIGVSVAALAVMRRASWWWIAMASALTLAAHAQIEVTPVWPGAAALFMLLIAAVAAPPEDDRIADDWPAPKFAGRLTSFLPAAAVLSLALLWPWFGLLPVAKWQGDLRAAAEAVRPVAEVRQRIERVMQNHGTTPDGDSLMHIARTVAQHLGQRPPQSQSEFERQLEELLIRTTALSQDHLESATIHARGHFQTTEALVRAILLRATAEWNLRNWDPRHEETARQLIRKAESRAREYAREQPSAAAWGLLGNILYERSQIKRDPAIRDEAIEAWSRAADLDPHGLAFPSRIFRTLDRYDEAGTERGRRWARRVVELDEQLRLDPLKQLRPDERTRVKAALGQ